MTHDLGDSGYEANACSDDFIAKPVDASEPLLRLNAAQRLQRQLMIEQLARERADRLLVYAAEASALLAHDLNNGFASAIANLQYLDQKAALDADSRDALESVLRVLRRMSALASNLVDVGRLEEGALVANRGLVDVAKLVDAVVSVHEPTLRAAGAHLEMMVPDQLLARIDSVLFERILHNLLGNASRYVSSGGLVTVRLAQDSKRTSWFKLEVANSGPPIPAHVLPALFEKYRTGTDGKAMRGMGLYFCRLATECHGGTISVDSSPHTCFRIQLPK